MRRTSRVVAVLVSAILGVERAGRGRASNRGWVTSIDSGGNGGS